VYGRSFLRLLALLLMMTACQLPAQSRGGESNLELARPIAPRLPLPTPIGPVSSELGGFGLPQLTRAAGIIFSGTVTAIERNPAISNQALETISITFRVESAIRGVFPGDELTIRQWIGLWTSRQRYHVGEHLLLFLYLPSKIGLTSLVGGAMGRFRVDPSGRVLLSSQQISALQRDPVLGGKSPVRLRDFALAVRQAIEEE